MAKTKKKKELSLEEKLEQALVPVDEQPYEVPENWCWVTVGNMVDLHRGVSYKKDEAHSVKEENDCLVMRGGNILEGAIDVEADNIYVNKSLIKPEQYIKENDIVIVSSTGSTKVIGRAGISYANYEDVSFGAFLTLVRPKEQICKKYIDYYFQSQIYRERIRSLASGVNINNIRAEYISNSPLPLPPLAEQQRIVEQIENLFEKLNEAKEKLQEAIDGVDLRKASILDKAFKGELTHNWRKSNEVSDKTWSKKTVGEVFAVFSGKGFKEKEYSTSGIKLLRISNVTYDALIWDDTKYLPMTYLEEVPELVLKAGDIVMALNRPITNGKLKVSIVDNNEKYILYQRVGCLRKVSEKDDIEYLQYALQSKKFLFQVESNLQGSDQPYINIPPLKSLCIDVCSSREQREIVKLLNQLIPLEDEVKNKAEMALEQIDLMKKAILAKAFRGELGTNNLDEESAVELLKSILATK